MDRWTNKRTGRATKVGQFRRPVAAGAVAALVALLTCGRAQAQVLEQVPDEALAVLKVRNLDDVSRKAAKMAKDLGLDQLDPDFADPLGSLEAKAHISKGVNKSGDMAIAFIDPEVVGGDKDKAALALVPVSDYKAFLGNFKDAKTQGDVTEAKDAEGDDIFISEWGNYAALSPAKEVLAKKPHGGLKLEGLAAKESQTKDALLIANIKNLRTKFLPELKKNRDQIIEQAEKGINENGGEALKPYAPVIRALINTYLNGAEEFLNDARSATVGLTLGDDGISGTLMADFEPGSYIGKLAVSTKNTTSSLLQGLPGDRQYFMFGGSTGDPKTATQLFHDVLDPIKTELAKVESAKQFVPALDALEKAAGVTTGMSIGYVAPKGALGTESIFQEVSVIRGTDVKTIQNSQRQMLESMSDLFKGLPQQQDMKVEFNLQKDAKTVEGVKLDTFETKFNIGEDNPQAAQIKQTLALIYGPNGQTGVMGQVSDKSVVVMQGAPDQLVTDAIAAAKKEDDALGSQQGVRAVAAQLPKNRTAVLYIDLGAVVGTAIRDAKGLGAPVNVKWPQTLPPIGITSGSDESAFRVDGFLPKTLVQAMISAGVQMQQQARNGGGGL